MLDAVTNAYLTSTDPGTPMGTLFRRFWVPVFLSDDLADPDGPPQRVTIMGEELVLFRDTEGRVGLVDAYCAHRGAPLFFARNEDCGLRCLYHGWKYDVSGKCVDTPNEPPQSRFKDHIALTAYPTQEAGGVIWAYMGPPEVTPRLPDLEWLSLDPNHYFLRRYLVECNYLQSLEGDVDPAHPAMLHSALDNGVADPWQVGDPQYTDLQMSDKHPALEVYETDAGLLTTSQHRGSAESDLWRLYPWLVPFYVLVPSEPGTPIIMNIRVPADDERCWFIRVGYSPTNPLSTKDRELWEHLSARFARTLPGTARGEENMDNDYLIDRYRQRYETFSGIPSVPGQDRAMVERMMPVAGRPGIVDRSREHLCSSDAAVVALRDRLQRFAKDLEAGIEPRPANEPEMYRVRAPAIEVPRGASVLEAADPYFRGNTWERQVREPRPAEAGVS